MLFTFCTRIKIHFLLKKRKTLKKEQKNLHKRWNGSLWFFYNFIFMVDFIPLCVAFVRPERDRYEGTRKIAMLKTWRCHHQDLSLRLFTTRRHVTGQKK